MVAHAPALPVGKRYDCVGFLYYSAFMQQTGAVPVCLGFSQVREDQQQHASAASGAGKEEGSAVASAPADASASALQKHDAEHQAPAHNFKMVCVGYSSFSSASPSLLPHCEGIEVVLHGPAVASQQSSSTGDNSAWAGQAGSKDSTSLFAPDSTEQQQQHPGAIVTRLFAKAAQNVSVMHTALCNEGPVKLKPLPKDVDELQARVVATLEKQGGRMQRGVQRVASNAYASTVKPLAAILGLSGTTSSTTTRSPKSPS